MRPWIAVAYSAPVAAASAVFLIYPVGQGSFSDGMPLGKFLPRLYSKLVFGKPKTYFNIQVVKRKLRCETCLNGKTPKPNASALADNSVPNRNRPQKQPGIYMILCLKNDWRYIGESCNISGRLASHKSMLARKIHPNVGLQTDWSFYGPEAFEFSVLYLGPQWSEAFLRRGKETELIVLNRDLCYNVLSHVNDRGGEKNGFWKRVHTPETKRKLSLALKGLPNDKLGKRISVRGQVYPSLAEASRQTTMARKTLRKKLNDPCETDFFEVQ